MKRKKNGLTEEYGLPDWGTYRDWVERGRIVKDTTYYNCGYELGMDDNEHYYYVANTREPESLEELHNALAEIHGIDPEEYTGEF